MTFSAFIEKWSASSGAERANKDLFFAELCDVLGIPRPNPVTGDAARDTYVFEKDVPFRHADGKQTTRKIDVYRHGAFLLEAKQGSTSAGAKVGTARRDTDAWNVAMQDALGQALGYARCIDDPPPFLVVADIGYCFDLYACFDRSSVWSPFPNAQHRRIHLRDLEAHADTLRAVFTDPHTLDPSKRSARVTREVATHLAELAAHLERAGHPQELVAQFLMRCLFTMFAEDVGLLPERVFTESIEKFWLPSPASFPGGIEQLWRTMNDGGDLFLVGKILRFNGGLFRGASALPLDRDGLARLLEAAKCDWSAVEPAIFGTLLERALDAKERHRLGAHYTPRAYVERLVRPTIEEPIRAEWDVVRAEVHRLVGKSLDGEGRASKKNREKAAKLVREFHRKLCGLRVLDPACGSGNFLYVTLDLFMRIESECLALLADLGEKQELLGLQTVRVNPGQFLGIEVKPWAKEIADLVLWIGFLLWHFRTYRKDRWDFEPVLSDYGNIACRDAVLAYDREELVRDPMTGAPVSRWDGEAMKAHPVTGLPIPDESVRTPLWEYMNPRRAEWPRADFIVGNPPFLGNKRMRTALGDGYVSALRAAHASLSDSADYVMYWWDHAARAVLAGEAKRFGLISTNSITQAQSRSIVSSFITEDGPLRIEYAIPDHPWVDSANGAAVRIAMTVVAAARSDADGVLDIVRHEASGSDDVVEVLLESRRGRISAALEVGVDSTRIVPLLANRSLSFMGVTLIGDGFRVPLDDASSMDLGAAGRDDVLRPYVMGRDLAQVSEDRLVVDFFGLEEAEARSRFPDLFQWVLLRVKPQRDQSARELYRRRWWTFGEPRTGLRRAVSGLTRFIATARTARHRIFQFVDARVLVDSNVIAIASDDAWVLGVLSSRAHIVWAARVGATLEDRPHYTPTSTFQPFPFPECGRHSRSRIADLAEQIDIHRKKRRAATPELTITGIYTVLEKLRSGSPLSPKEKQIHDAGAVSSLRALHDELDAAVLEAYGWRDIADEALLSNLVRLNAERRTEEKAGVVRWLRETIQVQPTLAEPPAVQDAGDGPETVDREHATTTRPNWPKALPDQLSAVRAEIRSLPAPFATGEVAARFAGANRADVGAALDCLAALGFVLRLGAGGEESFGAVG